MARPDPAGSTPRSANLVVPHQVFDDLARGRGGRGACRFLGSVARGRSLLLLNAVAEESENHAVRRSFQAFARMYDVDPEGAEWLVRYPSVSRWALMALRSVRDGAGAPAERMAALAVAAAIRTGQVFETRVPVGAEGLSIPSLGRISPPGLDAPGTMERKCIARVDRSSVRVIAPDMQVAIPGPPSHDAPGWQALRTIKADHQDGCLDLVIDDVDPYRFPPDGRPASRLDAAEVARWQARFQDAWIILRTHHPEMADEIGTVFSVVTPLQPNGCRQNSATSRTTFGTVALSLPPDPSSLAAMLVHEVQHAKLSMLSQLVDLVAAASSRLYYAPWRSDPRPSSAVLQGTYAHLGVAAFWRRHRHVQPDEAAHAEFARWRDAAASTARLLRDDPALTPLGHRFLHGMTEMLEEFESDRLPFMAARIARRAADRHRSTFEAANGKL